MPHREERALPLRARWRPEPAVPLVPRAPRLLEPAPLDVPRLAIAVSLLPHEPRGRPPRGSGQDLQRVPAVPHRDPRLELGPGVLPVERMVLDGGCTGALLLAARLAAQ